MSLRFQIMFEIIAVKEVNSLKSLRKATYGNPKTSIGKELVFLCTKTQVRSKNQLSVFDYNTRIVSAKISITLY